MGWVLVVVLMTWGGPAVVTQQFGTQHSCLQALSWMLANTPTSVGGRHRGQCFRQTEMP